MAIGIPSISSDVGAIKDVIKSSKEGLLVKNKDDWIKALGYLIKNKKQREEIGKNGREIIKKRYSLEVNVPKMLNFLENN